MGPSAPPYRPYLLLPVLWSGADQNEMGAWAPFKARGALPGPLVGSQRKKGEAEGIPPPKAKSPVSDVPTTEQEDAAGAGHTVQWEVSLVWKGKCACGWRGHWKPRPKETAPHSGLGAPQRLVCCVVWW